MSKIVTKEFTSFADLNLLKGIKMVHLNCCSIINKIDLVREQILNDNFIDVCCLSETWLTERHDSIFYQVDGYHLERADRIRSDRLASDICGGGLLVYVKNCYQLVRIDMTISTPDLELMGVVLSRPDTRA